MIVAFLCMPCALISAWVWTSAMRVERTTESPITRRPLPVGSGCTASGECTVR